MAAIRLLAVLRLYINASRRKWRNASPLIRQLACANELKMGAIWISNPSLQTGSIISSHPGHSSLSMTPAWLSRFPRLIHAMSRNPCLRRM